MLASIHNGLDDDSSKGWDKVSRLRREMTMQSGLSSSCSYKGDNSFATSRTLAAGMWYSSVHPTQES
jgi:hypothetical protein